MSRHAVALRAFSIASDPDTLFAEGEVIRGMDEGQFADFEHADLVRGAHVEDLGAPDPSPTSEDATAPEPETHTKRGRRTPDPETPPTEG